LKERAPYIINLNYAFGMQGLPILRELTEAINKRIESISIMGKAGIICEGGKKYDIMLPKYIVPLMPDGGVYHFPGGNQLTHEDFTGLTDAQVFSDFPMLTVPGIAIQSAAILEFFKKRYRVLGPEMEAKPYCDAIARADAIGFLCDRIIFNIGYWGSDNPLNPEELLARDHMLKGSKSANALVIAILNKTLNHGKPCQP
jgi:hypothetical protein